MLVDLRNHAASAKNTSLVPPHNLQSAAQDLIDLTTQLNRPWPKLIMGHSLGGKVALEYIKLLRSQPEAAKKLPKQVATSDMKIFICFQVWVLDSQISPLTPEIQANQLVDRIIHTIKSLPLPIQSRKWLYSHVRSDLGMSLQVAHWLGTNLEGHPNGPMTWVFNVDGAADMTSDYREVVKNPPKGTCIHIVRGDRSERWNAELINELNSIVNPSQETAKVHVLENAGHWLHADNPEGLLKLVLPNLVQI